MLLAGTRREEIEAAQAEIDRLDAQEHYVQDQLTHVHVVSPISGVIATPKPEEKVGEYARIGDLIVEVLELKTVSAEIAVSEKEISDVQVGQRVVLRARAMPWKTVRGRVAAISPTVATPTSTPSPRTVTVTTTVENPSLALKPNMTGVAKIYCGKHPLVSILTRGLSHYLRVDFWSWW